MNLTRTSNPSVLPVLLSDIRQMLNARSSDNQDLISLISSVTRMVENQTGQAFITQTWKLVLTEFRDEILLPRPPLQSVSQIQYQDEDAQLQTLDTAVYEIDKVNMRSRISLAYGQTWPSIYTSKNAVQITFVAGYGDANKDVPEPIQHAISLLVGHYFENREASSPIPGLSVIPMGYQHLLSEFTVPVV